MSNILLIIADDLGRNLGCYGEPAVQTPNIDKLASEGVLFENAFTSTASCSGSRSVIYTGLHTHQNGMYGLNHLHHHFMTFDNVESAPAVFNDLGYLTGIVNKVHVGPAHVYPWQVRDESWTRDVTWTADRAGAFFEKARDSGKPFFLTVGYIDPHRDATRGGFGNNDPAYPPSIKANPVDAKDVRIPHYLNDLPSVRQELAAYFESINRMDQGVGMLLERMKKAGYDDENTLVLFVSDNGAPFLNSKTTLYDAGVHLPFIVRCPRLQEGKAGLVNTNFVSFTDILPTFLDWAGHPERTNNGVRRGRSILPILSATSPVSDSVWPQHVFGSHTFHELTNYWPTRFLRTPRFKYHRNIAHQLDFPFSADIYGSLSWEEIRNLPQRPIMIGQRTLDAYLRRPPEELFDVITDPAEVKNLASDPAYSGILADFRSRLESWQIDSHDPWIMRDGVALIGIQDHLKAGMKLPDRFDFDPATPGNQNVATYTFDESRPL